MMELNEKHPQSMEPVAASGSFRLSAAANSKRRLFPDIHIDVGPFIAGIKQNSQQILAFSKSSYLGHSKSRLSSQRPHPHVRETFEDTLEVSQCLSISFGQSQRTMKGSQQEEEAEMFAAYPTTNRCSVCKSEFENYFQHIGTSRHRKNEAGGTFMVGDKRVSTQCEILKLINSVNQTKRRFPKEIPSANSLKSQSPEGRFDSADLDQNDGSPRKRRCLQSGVSIYVRSSNLKSLANSTSLPRKGSFFDE